jgi:hypothetical protein
VRSFFFIIFSFSLSSPYFNLLREKREKKKKTNALVDILKFGHHQYYNFFYKINLMILEIITNNDPSRLYLSLKISESPINF